MNIKECEVLSTVEYGSTIQGTADEHSDVDTMSIMLQPLVDSIFGDIQKSTHHKGGDRYYTAERFIQLTFKGSYDNILLLAAQLTQAKDSFFNQRVLYPFYMNNAFHHFVEANLYTLGMSLIGQMNKIILRKDELDGKQLLKYVKFEEQLRHLVIYEENYDYKTFALIGKEETDRYMKYKRCSEDELIEYGVLREVFGAVERGSIINIYKGVSEFLIKNLKNRWEEVHPDTLELTEVMEKLIKRACVNFLAELSYDSISEKFSKKSEV